MIGTYVLFVKREYGRWIITVYKADSGPFPHGHLKFAPIEDEV